MVVIVNTISKKKLVNTRLQTDRPYKITTHTKCSVVYSLSLTELCFSSVIIQKLKIYIYIIKTRVLFGTVDDRCCVKLSRVTYFRQSSCTYMYYTPPDSLYPIEASLSARSVFSTLFILFIWTCWTCNCKHALMRLIHIATDHIQIQKQFFLYIQFWLISKEIFNIAII